MITPWYWFLVFCTFLMAVITLHARSIRFLNFMLFGSLVGFVFDITAIQLGFYSYLVTDPVIIRGVPLTVSFAEGVGMSSIIFVFEYLWKSSKKD